MQTHKHRQITEGVIWKQLLLFFFPILMGSFFQQMYNTADTIIVGRFIGTQALAAAGSSSSLINLVNSFFIGLSSGAAVVLSQHYGAEDSAGTQKALHTCFLLALALGGLTSLLGFSAGPEILRMIHTPENCLQEAALYVQIYFSGAIATMIYNMGTGLLRAMGDSVRPTIFLIITCFLNIILDLLFVVVWKLGIGGAAAATVIAQCISAILVIICLRRLPEAYRLGWKQLSLEGPLLRRILAIGLPAGLQFMTYDLSNMITQASINSFGDVTAAAWTAYAKSDAIIWMIIGAFGVSITTFAGQNFGAGHYDRVRRGAWVCMGMSASAAIILSILEFTFREPILGIYTTDHAVIRTGAYMMQFAIPFIFLFIPVEILGGTMRGCGYSLVPTIVTTVFACVFRILWVTLIVARYKSLLLLVICYPISWFLCASVLSVVYFRGNWLQKQIQRLSLPSSRGM